MKFYQYINEANLPDSVINTIRRDCSEFINNIPPGFMFYRGVKNFNAEYKKVVPRKDRKPKDTPIEIHNYLDKSFQKKFGWKVRSEGVFATSNLEQSKSFGKPYYFFPSNGFKVVWEDYTYDIIDVLDEFEVIDHIGNKINNRFKSLKEQERIAIIDDIVSKYKMEGVTALKKISEYNVEAMFKCDFYYIVSKDIKLNELERLIEK